MYAKEKKGVLQLNMNFTKIKIQGTQIHVSKLFYTTDMVKYVQKITKYHGKTKIIYAK